MPVPVPRSVAKRLRHAEHATHDQYGIGRSAKKHDAANMLASKPLPQHKSILRTDRNDQAETQGQSLEQSRPDADESGCR